MCELIFAFVLMLIPVTPNDSCVTTASDLGLQPLRTIGQSHQSPVLLRVYDSQGELHAQWIGSRFGVLTWSTEPELLYLQTMEYGQHLLVAGDPSDGRLYRVHAGSGSFRGFASDSEVILGYYDGEFREKRIRLPAPIGGWLVPLSDRDAEDGLHIRQNEVWSGNRLLLPDRGLPHALYPSPSGRWILAVEDQLSWAPTVYAIAGDGSGRVQALGVVEPSDLPLTRQEPSRVSPDGQWTVTFRSWPWGILVTRRGGEQRLYHAAPLDGPWWAPDGQRFAYASDTGVAVIDLADLSRETQQAGVFWGGRSLLPRIPGWILGWFPEGIAWLTMGSSDHNDHGLPPNDWRETLDDGSW